MTTTTTRRKWHRAHQSARLRKFILLPNGAEEPAYNQTTLSLAFQMQSTWPSLFVTKLVNFFRSEATCHESLCDMKRSGVEPRDLLIPTAMPWPLGATCVKDCRTVLFRTSMRNRSSQSMESVILGSFRSFVQRCGASCCAECPPSQIDK